ncbi:MAG: hypothetical protein AAFX06_14310 [Planctomycetota bacterium]
MSSNDGEAEDRGGKSDGGKAAKRNITVMVDEGVSVPSIAKHLKSMGLEQIQEMPHILCLTGQWQGTLTTIREIKGVHEVEEQTTEYFPD